MKFLIFIMIFTSCNVLKTLTGGETDPGDDFFPNNNCDPSNTSNGGFCPGNDNNVYSLSNNLISFWRFDESGGAENRSDNFGNNHLLVTGSISFDSGVIGNALQSSGFDSGNYVNIGSPSGFNFGTGTDFSIAFWIKRNTQSGFLNYIFDKMGATDEIQVSIPASSTNINISIDGFFLDLNGVLTSLSTWYHIVFLVDRDAGITGYVNGNLFSSNTAITTGVNINNNVLHIGTFNGLGSTDNFAGSIDSMGVWSHLLNDDEINGLYHGNNILD